MKTIPKIMLIFVILCLCVGCDQVTKRIAKEQISPGQRIEWMNGMVVLVYTENSGAFLSLGARLPETVRLWALVVFVGVVLAGMLIFVLSTREIGRVGVLAMSLVIGGGASNLLDRIRYNGAVVDFLNVGIGRLRTGIFNVADVAIVAGIGLLIIWSFYFNKANTKPPNSRHLEDHVEAPQTCTDKAEG